MSYLFYMHEPLNWSQSVYGYYIGYHSLLAFTSNLLLLPLLKRRFHVADEVLLLVGMSCEMAGRIWTGFCRTTWMVFIGKSCYAVYKVGHGVGVVVGGVKVSTSPGRIQRIF